MYCLKFDLQWRWPLMCYVFYVSSGRFFCVSQMTVCIVYGWMEQWDPTAVKLARAVAAAPALRFSADSRRRNNTIGCNQFGVTLICISHGVLFMIVWVPIGGRRRRELLPTWWLVVLVSPVKNATWQFFHDWWCVERQPLAVGENSPMCSWQMNRRNHNIEIFLFFFLMW